MPIAEALAAPLTSLPADDAVPSRLGALERLAATDIESPLMANISRDLHSLFDPVCDDVLPIYFGPLLGRLYLEGL